MNPRILKPVEIHVPEPGDVDAILTVVVDQDNQVFFLRIFHNCGDILVEARRIFRQVKDDVRSVDVEGLVPAVFRAVFS